jgi:hypothetical protein
MATKLESRVAKLEAMRNRGKFADVYKQAILLCYNGRTDEAQQIISQWRYSRRAIHDNT